MNQHSDMVEGQDNRRKELELLLFDLEAAVDNLGLRNVLRELQAICNEHSERARIVLNNSEARKWDDMASYLDEPLKQAEHRAI